MSEPADDEPVPRLPRGRGLTLDGAMIFRIVTTLALLVMIVVTARPCAQATSKFVTGFGEEGSGSATAGKAMPQPGNVDVPKQPTLDDYEVLRPDMTEAEQKAAIERARQKAQGSAAAAGSASGSGSAAAAGSGAGSAAGSAP